MNNNDLTAVNVGDEFLLNVFVQDLRFPATGVFAAFLDVVFDDQLVSVNGDLTFGSEYQNVRSGDVETG